ncbi:OLC1v1034029C2 [Oldenlandia corymbosa var. corymbosa]|uniref:OLC1v1034029C2 n=1 Tax=Oldenlandia corymbosa var. corymbosa TaxID=529605 RepID=A0AAV1CQB1_OLDCO|nr:OLC1v1034029C2 [Oldenlandia corymbosa var. corymbosa]
MRSLLITCRIFFKCSIFAGYLDVKFLPFQFSMIELSFQGLNQGAKSKSSLLGTVALNLAEFAVKAPEEFNLNIPLALSGSVSESRLLLNISLSLLELRALQDSTESVQRTVFPIPSPTQSADTSSTEKDELSALKAGLRKVKIFTDYVSTRRAKKACREEEASEGRCSAKSEEGDYGYPFDTDSLDDFDERESDDGKEDPTIRKSFSYGTLAYANFAGGSFYSNSVINDNDEDWIYYSNRKSDVGCARSEDPVAPVPEPSVVQNTKRSILPWRKRKLSFRSPKAKGEPLLKKDCGEEGGDDIDYDRRQLSSDESFSFWWRKTDEESSAHRSSISDFGDDNFAVGSWEQKEIMSRDGFLKLQTQVFFASIDQRSERAAGESACTALVAVIADWLQSNRDYMPIKSQFDSLIREGSLEWRNLCENETYMQRFPDKHFDLETVLEAKIRSLSVLPGKSFVGFFYPDGMEEGRFDFLQGAMSFDNIWEEISNPPSNCSSDGEPHVYVVSWNDHFFVLKVDTEAYYIIDTLGERLYEGCNQAYILKFDRNTAIYKVPDTKSSSGQEKSVGDQPISAAAATGEPKNPSQEQGSSEGSSVKSEAMKSEEGEEAVVCQGKESCKDYIKNFLAAIPIRELQADMKKGLIKSTPVHHRLQIEFHFTKLQEPVAPVTPPVEEAAPVKLEAVEVEEAAPVS